MYSAYKLNEQGDNIQPWCTPFLICNQSVVPCSVLTVACWPASRFLRRLVRWSGILTSLRIFHSLLWSTLSKALARLSNLTKQDYTLTWRMAGFPHLIRWSILSLELSHLLTLMKILLSKIFLDSSIFVLVHFAALSYKMLILCSYFSLYMSLFLEYLIHACHFNNYL